MTDLYIDPINGNDVTGTGASATPYRTLQHVINPSAPILTVGDTIYLVGTVIGQPNYVYQLFDTKFWEDSETSNIVKLIRTLQYALYASLESSVREVQLNWYTRLAVNLERFTSIFGNKAYNNMPYETFRRRVTDTWLAFMNPATKVSLNSIVGAYTYLPIFSYKLPDWPDELNLGTSCLGQETQPETYVLTRDEYRAGIIIEIFNTNSLTDEFLAEMLKLLDWNVSINSFRYILHETAQPSGYLTIQTGVDAFDKAVMSNSQITTRGSIEPILSTQAVNFRTYPIDIYPLGNDDDALEVAILDRILTDAVQVITYYRFGSSINESDPSWGTFRILDRGNPFITLEQQYVQFRITAQPLQRTDDYEFYSIIIKGNELKVVPGYKEVLCSTIVPLIVSGGRQPYTYMMLQSESGGTVSPAGVYTAGTIIGEDIVRVRDSQSAEVFARFNVIYIPPDPTPGTPGTLSGSAYDAHTIDLSWIL